MNEFNIDFILSPKINVHILLPHMKRKKKLRKKDHGNGLTPPGAAWAPGGSSQNGIRAQWFRDMYYVKCMITMCKDDICY